MIEQVIPKCCQCRFVCNLDGRLECRKNPPHMDEEGIREFPLVYEDDWCGSFSLCEKVVVLPEKEEVIIVDVD